MDPENVSTDLAPFNMQSDFWNATSHGVHVKNVRAMYKKDF